MTENELRSSVDRFLAGSPAVPGCVVYRIDDDDGGSVVAGGFAAQTDGRAMVPEATSRIASSTKPFTAATVLRLAEEGALRLDDGADVFVAGRAATIDLEGITILDLLQHTSGLPDMDGQEFMDELYNTPDKVWTPWEKIEQSILGRPRTGPPGPPARYCDVGYVLLAMI